MNRNPPILFFSLTLLFSSTLAFALESEPMIELSQQGFDFSVAVSDEPNIMGWSTARRACNDKGMRLPTLEEWGIMHCHSDLDNTKDHFRYPETDKACKNSKTSRTVPDLKASTYYWSSKEYNMGVSQYSDTFDGHQGYKEKREKLRVRCVR